MNFFAIYLAHKRVIAVKREWIQNPVLRSKTKFFYSENPNATADYTTCPLYYINKNIDACYDGFILQGFGKLIL